MPTGRSIDSGNESPSLRRASLAVKHFLDRTEVKQLSANASDRHISTFAMFRRESAAETRLYSAAGFLLEPTS